MASPGTDPYTRLRANWFAQLTGIPFNQSIPSVRAAVHGLGAAARGVSDTMETSRGRGRLWSDLPLGTSSANARASFNRLKGMALAYVARRRSSPGAALEASRCRWPTPPAAGRR
ncbi:hypothetical protein ACQEVZ_39370 [Dactylosporangium sp. CA-152071]|uniref:hypothetical protein n=1 Tax=Dactylosporangium sp. CA-152071 TaxID=3239933 RepID=UPI003D8A0FB0